MEKGTLVVFSAGNDNAQPVKFPSFFKDAISVGASSPCDTRKRSSSNEEDLLDENGDLTAVPDEIGVSCDQAFWWGSNFGEGLDVMAPGEWCPSLGLLNEFDVYTLEPGFQKFNGTSAAAPHTSGVLALMLSANPDLSEEEARFILESTCDKIDQENLSYQNNDDQPNGSWNPQTGYGRINALRAVRKALEFKGETCILPEGNQLQFDYESNVTLVSILSDTSWIVESNFDWIKLNDSNTISGENDGEIPISIEENESVFYRIRYNRNLLCQWR